jgi:hypothetical protein
MRPLSVLIGIVMGSTVSMTVSLALTWIVFLFLPEHADRIDPERAPLLRALGLSALLSAAAVLSFYGELRSRPWRRPAHAGLVMLLALATWVYWPD